ncbi:MAG TPA: phosphomannose isomerase type II C-terminal cupin domain [Chroococcales cyanobacterium]
MDNDTDRCDRPWGTFIVLQDLDYTKVKRLVVKPGHRLSLQSHKHRDEHWVVVKGVATVTLDEQTRDFKYGEHVYVARGTRHRIANQGTDLVEIIEVQTGDAFPEEDIVRYSDDYNRADV